MKLLDALKRPALSLVAAPVAPAPAARADRSRLKAEIADLAATHQAIIDARATVDRLREIERAGDDAARAASDAQRTEEEFRSAWAAKGCPASEAEALQAFAKAAREKSEAAQIAANNAQAAADELERCEEQLRRRESHLEQCEVEISAAIGEILVTEARPLLKRFERCAEEYRDLRFAAVALMRIVAPQRYGPGSANEAVVLNVLRDTLIKSFDWNYHPEVAKCQETLDAFAAPWLERAAQLRKDPDA